MDIFDYYYIYTCLKKLVTYKKITKNVANKVLKKYEEEYCRNTYCGNSEGGDFHFEDRGSRLILTAPHAVRTLRDNRPKAPDLCTGALTRLAGEQNDVSTIIRRRTGEE